ncbi:glutathione S-transferase [Acidovorax sp. Root267]|uniref:glutathione transferase GstA n=1 Tax=unclassified Acidovorax TaxID=2684926 RepID=UPI00070AD48A|nr:MULTISPECIES: glutathione transferase GstA [unclassified Acidovorax]KRD21698.1 glutathione S-transferase [Acidovorax sp. Root267]MBD9392458.1 glutathione transferase GstA [Acidovorax sp. ACV01]
MKLYFSPAACSLSPHILLLECGLPFALEKVDTARHQTADGQDFYAINPKGQVPVLELDDGSRLTEGPVIAQYIADQAQATQLMPAAGTRARYRVMEWQNYVSTELHKSFTPLFHAGLDDNAKAALAALLRKKMEWLDAQLQDGNYLTGEHFTAADAYLFVVLGWAKFVKLDISDLAHLQAFMRRVAARPAVQAAMRAEGLLG